MLVIETNHMGSFIDTILEKDTGLFVFLNGKYAEWIDPVMIFLSAYYSWVIFCISIAVIMAYVKHRIGAWAVLFAALTTVVNAFINNIIKIIICRPRPIHVDTLQGVFRSLEEYEASYSFFSAHSSNAFCIAVFTSLFLRNKIYSFFILLWAAMVSYSRIYVGKHFPLDVLCGILFGILTGYIGYRLFLIFSAKKLSPQNG